MRQAVIVINPNSTQAVTDGIDAALDPLRGASAPEIECLTLAEGPPGIESQRHVDEVAGPLCRLVEASDRRAAAFVIACFSDPGLQAARQATLKPVFGISESGLLTALALGERVGIIAILPASVRRHERLFRDLGIERRIAGERAIGMGVAELGDAEKTLARMTEAGRRLRDEDGADVLVMGCAGMADYGRRSSARWAWRWSIRPRRPSAWR